MSTERHSFTDLFTVNDGPVFLEKLDFIDSDVINGDEILISDQNPAPPLKTIEIVEGMSCSSFLSNVCSQKYKQPPVKVEQFIGDVIFTVTYTVYGITAAAIGKSKKAASEAAAKNLLLKIAKDKSDQFKMPGDTYEETVKLIEKMYITPQTNTPIKAAVPVENFTGKVIQICQNKKVTIPTFNFSVEGVAHNPLYECSAEVPSLAIKVKFTARSKKDAKNGAAKLIYEKIVETCGPLTLSPPQEEG